MKWCEVTDWDKALPYFSAASDVVIPEWFNLRGTIQKIQHVYQVDSIWYMQILFTPVRNHSLSLRDVDLELLLHGYNESDDDYDDESSISD